MRTYTEFLKDKEKNVINSGFDIKINELNDNLFKWQKLIVKWALKKGRCALFEDCGLGKTIQQLEWAQQIINKENESILIIAPLAVSKQTKNEGLRFGYTVNICKTPSDIQKGINITNYERLEKFNFSDFIGIVLDESSIIKSFAGIGSEGYQALKMKRRFIGIELKKSYFDIAIKNLRKIENKKNQLALF